MPQLTATQLQQNIDDYITNITVEDGIPPANLGGVLKNIVDSTVNKNSTSQGAFKYYANYNATTGLDDKSTPQPIPGAVAQFEGRLYEVTVEGEQDINGTGNQLYHIGDLIVCCAVGLGFMWRVLGNTSGGSIATGTPYSAICYDASGTAVSTTTFTRTDGSASLDFEGSVVGTPGGNAAAFWGDDMHGMGLLGGSGTYIAYSPGLNQAFDSSSDVTLDFNTRSGWYAGEQRFTWGTDLYVYHDVSTIEMITGASGTFLPRLYADSGFSGQKALGINSGGEVQVYDLALVLNDYEINREQGPTTGSGAAVNIGYNRYGVGTRSIKWNTDTTVHHDNSALATLFGVAEGGAFQVLHLYNNVAGTPRTYTLDSSFALLAGTTIVVGQAGDTHLRKVTVLFSYSYGKLREITRNADPGILLD